MAKPVTGKAPVRKVSGDGEIVSLKIVLRGIRPPIWRRILVLRSITLGDLHRGIQAVMEWEDTHLHVFEAGGRLYGDRTVMEDVQSEHRTTLDALLRARVTRFTYLYDFGDRWDHSVTIEKTLPVGVTRRYPACVAGKRNCPPEDCGGPLGYSWLISALADPDGQGYDDALEWVAADFDPEEFLLSHADAGIWARLGDR